MADFDTINKVKDALMLKRAAVMDYGIVPGEPYVGMEDEKVEADEQKEENKEQIVAGKDEPTELKEPKGKKKVEGHKVKKAPAADSTLMIRVSSKSAEAVNGIVNLVKQLR